MTSKKRKKPRVYTLRDLAAMADQLGCVVKFEMVPVEQPQSIDARFTPSVKGTAVGSATETSSSVPSGRSPR